MEPVSKKTYLILFLGVLLPACGMVLFGVTGLWQALRSAQIQAEEEARQRALSTAKGIRTALGLPAVLNLLPKEKRFSLTPRGPALPPGLAWITQPPESPPLPARTRILLEKAEEEEFSRKDPDAAARVLERALERKDLRPEERQAFLLARAWLAQRRKDLPRRDACLQALGGKETFPPLRPSHLLLLSRTGRPLPPWTREALLSLPYPKALALVDLLEIPEKRKQTLRVLLEEAKRRRRFLGKVMEHLELLRKAKAPIVQSTGKDVLLFFPRSPGPDSKRKDPPPVTTILGQGALLPREVLLRRLRKATDLKGPRTSRPADLPLFPWSGEIRFGPLPPGGGFPLWRGAWIAPGSPPPGGIWSRPWIPASLLGLLSLLFLTGLSLVLRAAARERRALQVRSEFLTSVTHELRTPLASIRMFAEMLTKDRVRSEEKRKEYYRLLAGEAGRLSALVENVLDLGRMERGERAYDMRPLDFAALVQKVLDLFAPLVRREGMEIQSDLEGPASVLGDRNALEQALNNLLENARKYARQGGIVQVRLNRSDGEVRLSIRDRGPGVPPGEREKIFERFARGKTGKDGSAPGLGLGLYLAGRIVEAHGGRILCLDPEDGLGGALFEIRLPGKEEDPP